MHRAPRPLSATCLLLLSLALPAPGAVASDASVAARLEARGIQYVVDEDGDYRVTYSYSQEGRTQLVFVSGRTESIGGFRVREVFAPAAVMSRDGVDGPVALQLLADSGRRKLGAWESRGDMLFYVIKLPDSADAAELEAAMDIAAEVADDKEIELSGDRDEL